MGTVQPYELHGSSEDEGTHIEEEWGGFTDEEIGMIDQKENDVMPTLRLSYNHPAKAMLCIVRNVIASFSKRCRKSDGDERPLIEHIPSISTSSDTPDVREWLILFA